MAGKGAAAFNMDASEAHSIGGFLEQLSLEMKTNRHLSSVVNMSHEMMVADWLRDFDAIARAAPESYHHVYEWGMVGLPGGRLWKDTLSGRQENKVASFDWRASVKVVPIPDIDGDPEKGTLKEVHVFVWKAPVMEYDVRVNIVPKQGKFLVFPTGDASNPLFFSKDAIYFYPGRQQAASGESRLARHGGGSGPGVVGKFTAAYMGWWGGAGAEESFETSVRKILEGDLRRMPIEKATARARTKTFSISRISANPKAAYAAGRAEAKKWVEGMDQNYIAMARTRNRKREATD